MIIPSWPAPAIHDPLVRFAILEKLGWLHTFPAHLFSLRGRNLLCMQFETPVSSIYAVPAVFCSVGTCSRPCVEQGELMEMIAKRPETLRIKRFWTSTRTWHQCPAFLEVLNPEKHKNWTQSWAEVRLRELKMCRARSLRGTCVVRVKRREWQVSVGIVPAVIWHSFLVEGQHFYIPTSARLNPQGPQPERVEPFLPVTTNSTR